MANLETLNRSLFRIEDSILKVMDLQKQFPEQEIYTQTLQKLMVSKQLKQERIRHVRCKLNPEDIS